MIRKLNILVAGIVTLLVFITLYHVQNNKEGYENKQYNQFSSIYFNKIKQNILISEI